jgi:microcin C transport system substrate-binding protein
LSIKFPLRACAAALAISVLSLAPAAAQEKASETVWRHGLAQNGELKYPEGFKHFDYVNPNAPKGGAVRLTGFGTYDNFNIVVAGVKGSIASGITEIYDTLMAPSLDEIDSEYGQLAEGVTYPQDVSSATFRLRSFAKCVENVLPAVLQILSARDEGREDGRSRHHVHV